MKRKQTQIVLIVSMLMLFGAADLFAQSAGSASTTVASSNGDLAVPIASGSSKQIDKVLRPARLDKSLVPDDVQSRLEQFKVARELFLANQKDLTSKLKDATQEERDKIRDLIQLQKQQFKAQAKELAQQVKDSVRDLDPALGHKVGQEGTSPGRGGRPDH